MTFGDAVSVEVADAETDHPVVTVLIRQGAVALRVMGEPEWHADRLVLRRAHLQADAGLRANSLGSAGARRLARQVMEALDVRELVVEGEVRTTGAHPGRRPRALRFTRPLPVVGPSAVNPDD